MRVATLLRHGSHGIREAARAGFHAWGRSTANARPLPDYLIIGTKRGGTTSMWKNLRKHPQVLSMYPEVENLKSPHYFDINFHRGERWYRSYFPTSYTRSRRSRGVGGPVLVGDASPYYLFHPVAASRAASVVPGAKIIVLLRNPVDRAYSHFQERTKEGTEHRTFEVALQEEAALLLAAEQRLAEDSAAYVETHDFCSYRARGRYLEQLERWTAHFPPESMLVLASERYYADPATVLCEAFTFLGIAGDMRLPDLDHMNRLPSAPIASATRRELNAYYRPHVAALEQALNRDFGWDLGQSTEQPNP